MQGSAIVLMLISTLVIVSFSYFDRISSIDKSYEIYTLYDSAIFYIKAWDYAFCKMIQICPLSIFLAATSKYGKLDQFSRLPTI